MFKQILISAALVGTALVSPVMHANAEGLAVKTRIFPELHKRKYRKRLVRDYLDNGLRDSSTPTYIYVDSNSAAASSSNSSSRSPSFVYRPFEINGPLNKVSDITHVSDDMVDLAESRAQWRAANGIPEQTEPMVVIAGASRDGERVSAPTFMPDTYSRSVDDESEVFYLND